MHSHWGTERGHPADAEQRRLRKANWNSEVRQVSEDEMCEHFREQNVRVMLDLHYPKFLPLEQMRPIHDYALDVQKANQDVVLGHWIHIDPRTGEAGLDELRRCVGESPGLIGFGVSGSGTVPASDPAYEPFLRYCSRERVPVLVFLGTTAYGAGKPAGGGVLIDHCHPRHLDFVAASYPDLKIVAGRPAWPWQAEANAVLLHKRSVWYELHGWSPKYHDPELKREISRRLQDRIMFGADYPMLSYERLEREWRAEGYSEEVLEKVFWRNAERFLAQLGR
ncbi:MAG: amidohydrolase family protein [Pseudomonadota bacterium]